MIDQIRYLIIFFALAVFKIVATILYRCEYTWVGSPPNKQFQNARVVALLNHTSLFEPLYIIAVPWFAVWRMSRHAIIPAADITLDRPLVGKIVRFLAPKVIPITRKRDASWDAFMSQIDDNSQVWIAPEGRMMRRDGFDKSGQPMSIKGGIADILGELNEGQIVLAYSAGLHHVQHPGEGCPKIFKTIKINIEQISIADLKKETVSSSVRTPFKLALIDVLEERKRKYLPAL